MKLELTHDGQTIVIEQEADTGTVTIHFALQDVDESGRTQPVIIHLTENVEVVIPKLGLTPGIMDPDNEWAVARVELMNGEARAMAWDHEAVASGAESVVLTLIPADAALPQ